MDSLQPVVQSLLSENESGKVSNLQLREMVLRRKVEFETMRSDLNTARQTIRNRDTLIARLEEDLSELRTSEQRLAV